MFFVIDRMLRNVGKQLPTWAA